MFSIRWPKAVNRKLLEASANADGPGLSVLLTAMADIESHLHNEPEFVGESRDADHRLLIINPLSVTYKIDFRHRIVKIVRVRGQPTAEQ